MVSIVVPINNDGIVLEEKLQNLKTLHPSAELIVIDNCSTDNSREILNKSAFSEIKKAYFSKKENRSRVIREGINLAAGDYVMLFDIKAKTDFLDIAKIINIAVSQNTDVIYGSRILDRSINRKHFHFRDYLNYFGNMTLSMLVNILFFAKLTDIQTPVKLFKRNIIGKLDLRFPKFGFEAEFTAKLLKNGYQINEIPIYYCPLTKNNTDNDVKWQDGVMAIIALIKYRFVS